MTNFTAASYMSNSSRTESEMKAALEDNLAATKQLPGAAAQTTLTLASDQITPTGAFHLVDTQAAAATDNLAQILQTNLPDGSWLMLGIVSASRTVVFKHAAGGTGQLTMLAGADVTVDNITTFLTFQRHGTLWEERNRFFGTAQAAFRSFYAVAGLGQNTFTGRQEWKKGANLASAATLTLGTDGNFFHVTGTTPITAISSTPAGTEITLTAESDLTLTHNATNLALLPPLTRSLRVGEAVRLVSEGAGTWREIRPWVGAYAVSGGTTHNASQSETVVYSVNVAPNTLASARRLRVQAHCNLDWRNSTADTLTIRLKFGDLVSPPAVAVTVADPGGTTTGMPLVIEAWLSANFVTNQQLALLTIQGPTNPLSAIGHALFAIDSTVLRTLQLTAQFTASGSPSTVTVTPLHVAVELL